MSRSAFVAPLTFVFIACLAFMPAASAQIQVSAAYPPAGEQGSLNLNVKIIGKVALTSHLQ